MHKEIKQNLFTKKKRVLTLVVGGSAFVIAFLLTAGWFTHGTIETTYQQASVAVDTPLEVELNQRLLQVPLDKIEITPRVEGSWTLERSFISDDKLRFVPDRAFSADTTYTVTMHDVRRITGIGAKLPDIVFDTENAPGIAEVSFDDKATVAADTTFRVSLSAENRGLRNLELRTSSKQQFVMSSQDDTVFRWKSNTLLPQGQELIVKIIDKKTGNTLVSRTVRVAESPRLDSRPQESNFGQQDKVKLVFAQSIDPDSAAITFSTDGDGVWQDDKTYVFAPKEVVPGTTYTYTIPKGLRSKAGGIIEEDQKYHFATPGVVAVAAFSPRGQELAQVRQVIKVTFNQPVDKKSAEEHVTVSRGTITARLWEGDTLVLTGVNFGSQQTVQVNVAAGVKPVFGLASTHSYGYSFTTEIPVRKLSVPMYYQQYAQSCEAASLRMALSYRGVQDNDWNILQRFGYDPRPLNKDKNEWDDPQQQFVGDVGGNQGKGTGWGVYAEPVAKAARSYGRGATTQYGVTASFVARNIHQGNPVILWGIWDETATQRSWRTPDGRTISGPIPMHVRLVIGVKGSADRPVGFYIHDPITGPTYWTANYMVYNAQRAGAANMAVAVQ